MFSVTLCIRWFWMFVFERYNKRIKGMVKNRHWVAESLARHALLETATRYFNMVDSPVESPNKMVSFVGKGRLIT